MYQYVFSDKAEKEFSKLEHSLQLRIIEKLDYICSSPNPLIYSEHLTNFDIGSYRFRVGDYRVIFDLESDTLKILKIGHRNEIYR